MIQQTFKIIIISILVATLLNSAEAQSIKDLGILIGKWEVTETILPGTDKAYKETGIRKCEYYLDSAFIKCEAKTVVSTSGKNRTYLYLINYNKEEDYFQAANFANDFPLHGYHIWYLNKTKTGITFITPKNVNGDRFFRGTIEFEGNDKIIWNGWASKFRGDLLWKQIFNDVAVRIE